MGRKSWVVLCVLVLCAGTARAQCAAGATTKSEPAGFRAEYLDDMKALEQRVLALADAVPEEKYAWKPAEGVRSVQDVLLHIATTNYTFPRMVGVAPPQGLDLRGLSSLSTGKTKIREALAASFAHARAGVGSLPDADLERIVQGQHVDISQDADVSVAPCLRTSGSVDCVCASQRRRAAVDGGTDASAARETAGEVAARWQVNGVHVIGGSRARRGRTPRCGRLAGARCLCSPVFGSTNEAPLWWVEIALKRGG